MKWSAIAVGMIAVVMQSTDAAMFGNMKKAPATKEIQLSTDIMPTWKDLAPRSNTKKIQLTRVYKYWATLEKRDKKAIKSLYSSLKEENKAVEKVDDFYDGAKKCLRKQDETKRKTRTAVNKALQEIAQCIKKTVTVPTFTVVASQNLPKDFDEVDKANFDDDDKDNDKDDDKDDDDDDGKTTGLAAKPTVTPTVVKTPPTVMTMAPMLTPSPVVTTMALPVDVPLAPPLVHMPDVDVPPVRPTFSIAQLMEPVVDKDDGYNGPVNGGYQVGPKPEPSIDGGLVFPQEPLTPEQPIEVVNVNDGGYHGEPEPSIDGGLTFPEVLPAPEKPHEEIVGGDSGYQPPVGEPEPQQSIDGGFVYHEEPPTPEQPHEYIIHGEGYYPTIADDGYHGETEPEPATPIEPIDDNGNPDVPEPAGVYGYHGEPEPTGLYGNPGEPEPAGLYGNPGEPEPTGLYGNPGEPEPTGFYGNPGEPVLEPSKSGETLLAPGEQVSDLADVIQPTGLGLDPNSWPFSPVSPDVPPLWALDMDHSNAVDFNEWAVYLKRLHGMAMEAVEAGRDPVAVNLLRQIVDFHYGALGQCLMKRMGGPDGVQELHDPEYEAVAKWIQDNCYVKFRYSLFAGVPPFEWIAKDMPTVPASTIEKWFTHKVETARIDLHVKHIVSLAPEHEELVEKFIGCTYTILNQANDASVDRDAYYGALQQIEMCGRQ